MKLELKHLAGYLPYKLNIYFESLDGKEKDYWILDCNKVDFMLSHNNKPILRPLSDLTKEIEVNGEKFVPIDKMKSLGWFNMNCNKKDKVLRIPFRMMQFLLEWHFDIYGLIENNLAIDKNTIL